MYSKEVPFLGGMEMQGENIINGIIGKTENEAIFMFILFLVAIVIIALPIYKLSIEKSKERQQMENDRWDRYTQRESALIDVITRNTEVISELKTLFETTLDMYLDKITDLSSEVTEVKQIVNEKFDKLIDSK